jgi:hypothetical protein
MGCGCIEEAENKQTIVSENQPKKIINEGEKKSDKENKKSKEKEKDKEKEKEKHKQKSKRKAEKDQIVLDINKRKINDKIIISQVTDDNKDALSNVATEGVTTTDGQILATRKQQCNGVTILQGIEECFSEDLDEDDILQIVGDALADHIIEGCDEQIPGTVTFDQVRVIAKILYKKINKKDDEDEKDGEINMKNYPELKGLNIRIGVSQLTKDVIKKMMFSGQKVDDCQIDLTYANLIKDNSNMKALSIEILP